MFSDDQPIRYCCVLTCGNNSKNTNKLFVSVPRIDLSRRHTWMYQIGRPHCSPKSRLFCCEDHFYFPTDCENYEEWTTNGGVLQLNRTALPRFNLRKDQAIYGEILDDLSSHFIKWCFVPSCTSTINKKPIKIFFRVPEADQRRRKHWFFQIRNNPTPDFLFCCEDHFDFTTDIVNFPEYLRRGCDIRLLVLKEDVVPHLNLHYRDFPSHNYNNVLTVGGKTKPSADTEKCQSVAKRLDFQAEIVKITPSKEEDVSLMIDSEIEHNQKRKNKKKLTEKRNYGGYDGLKLVTSRYGKDLLLHNGNSYCKSHVLRSGRVRWRRKYYKLNKIASSVSYKASKFVEKMSVLHSSGRCSRRTRKLCRAQFITEPDKTTFVPGTARLQHNHPPIFPVHEKNTTHNKRNVEKSGNSPKKKSNMMLRKRSTYYSASINEYETLRGRKEKENSFDEENFPKSQYEKTDITTAKRLFLLSFLPDLKEMSTSQLQIFKQNVFHTASTILS